MKIRISMLSDVVLGALAGSAVTALLILGSAHAADEKQPAAPPAIVTVYVAGHFSSADDINKTHSKYFAQGYRFAAMTTHNENGDHKGVWVTYVRNE
jgi:hypothetical protein